MKNPWLHRSALLLALFVLLLIATGGALTSLVRPVPGTPPAAPVSAPLETPAQLEPVHIILGGIVAILSLVLALFTSSAAQLAAWIALGLIVTDGWLGIHSGAAMLPPWAGVLHALLSPIALSTTVALAVFTSDSWQAPPLPAQNLWPPLRKLAIWTPLLLVAQIALGAAFRHNAMGVVWHILNAMVVLMLILVLGICALRVSPAPPALRNAALALLIITSVQVLLGFGVYITLLMVSENNLALMTAGAIHVLTGSLTLASSLVLTLQIAKL